MARFVLLELLPFLSILAVSFLVFWPLINGGDREEMEKTATDNCQWYFDWLARRKAANEAWRSKTGI